MGVHGIDHLLILVRTCHGEHLRVGGADGVCLITHAAGHDNAPVLCEMASPIAARLSSFALSRKPQVFTSTTSAPA